VHALISEGADEFLTEVDGALLEALREPWPLGFELIRGVTGLGVYFMERLRGGAVTARPGVVRVVEQLAAMAETSPDGTTHTTTDRKPTSWFSVPW
jgi:hypothetical protein